MRPDLLDEIIARLDGLKIPPEFVLMGRFITPDGLEHTLSGDDLARVLNGEDRMPPDTQVRLLLNVGAIKRVMLDDVSKTFERVNQLIRDRRTRGLPLPPPDLDRLL